MSGPRQRLRPQLTVGPEQTLQGWTHGRVGSGAGGGRLRRGQPRPPLLQGPRHLAPPTAAAKPWPHPYPHGPAHKAPGPWHVLCLHQKGTMALGKLWGGRQGLWGWRRRSPETPGGCPHADITQMGATSRVGRGHLGWAAMGDCPVPLSASQAPRPLLSPEPGTRMALPGPLSPMLASGDEIFK